MRRVATRAPYAAYVVESPTPERIRGFRALGEPLHLVAARGQLEALREKLDRGASPDARSSSGATLLHLSAYCDQPGSVRLLASRGADLEARDAHTGGTPLVWAALGRGVSALRELLDLGADLAAENRWGETALVLSVRSGRADAVRHLLSSGASARSDWQGKSLLELAVARGHGEVAVLLRGARADRATAPRGGRAPR